MYNVPNDWKLGDLLELSLDEKLKWLYDAIAGLGETLPEVSSSDNGKVLAVSGGKWSGVQENYVAGDKFTNSEDVLWSAGTFTSTTSFRFLISLPKRRFSGTARVTKAKASIYYYNGTNKANDIDFIQTEGYSASVRILSDSLAMIQLIAPSAYSSVTAGSNGSVYFAKDAFEITFDS